MDNLEDLDYIGTFKLRTPFDLDFDRYEYYSVQLCYEDARVMYGYRCKIFPNTTEISSVALSSGDGFVGINLRKVGTQFNVNNTTFTRFHYGGAYVESVTDESYRMIVVHAKRRTSI